MSSADADDSGPDVAPHPRPASAPPGSARPETKRNRCSATYAIVKTGGKQYKVAVGDVVKVEKLDCEPGAKVSLPVALVVDGAKVTSDAKAWTRSP